MSVGKRTYWYKKNLHTSANPEDDGLAPVPSTEEKGNLVGSLNEYGYHMPVLDIDYPAKLVPSSTEGHYHLYLDKQITWDAYKKVLEALAEAGLIQAGFRDWSIKRSQSFVRKPGVKKESIKVVADPVTLEALTPLGDENPF